MYSKINELKTDAILSRIKILELLTKTNYVTTNAHPYAMWYLIKESIELKIWKQDLIIDLANVNIKLVVGEIYALKSRFKTLKIKVDANPHEAFSDADRTSLQHIQFQVTDPHGSFAKLEHDLTGTTTKFGSGGGGEG